MPPTTPGEEWKETVLYHFQGRTDGATPLGGLISDEKGNLYGTTTYTVFELSPPTLPGGAWTFSLLHEFEGGTGDGTYSHAGWFATVGAISMERRCGAATRAIRIAARLVAEQFLK